MALVPPLPDSARLADLIDCGYSDRFAVQLEFSREIEDIQFFVFDDEDRRNWGDTLLAFDPRIMRSESGWGGGYASCWMGGHHRLICVAPGKSYPIETGGHGRSTASCYAEK